MKRETKVVSRLPTMIRAVGPESNQPVINQWKQMTTGLRTVKIEVTKSLDRSLVIMSPGTAGYTQPTM